MKKLLGLLGVVALLSACSSTNESGGLFGNAECDSMEARDFMANAEDRVFFAYDSSAVSSSAADILDTQAAWLKKNKNVNIVVQGHCDERGTREYNLALGERRANAVKKYLVSQGVAADRITVISYGKERPAVLGNNETAWAQNRRGVTVVKVNN
jgi:peptidoglycan-associated lipoprotein